VSAALPVPVFFLPAHGGTGIAAARRPPLAVPRTSQGQRAVRAGPHRVVGRPHQVERSFCRWRPHRGVIVRGARPSAAAWAGRLPTTADAAARYQPGHASREACPAMPPPVSRRPALPVAVEVHPRSFLGSRAWPEIFPGRGAPRETRRVPPKTQRAGRVPGCPRRAEGGQPGRRTASPWSVRKSTGIRSVRISPNSGMRREAARPKMRATAPNSRSGAADRTETTRAGRA
jgi:hypothetical protein